MSEVTERYNICMVGPRAVGKTSLLAAMYSELHKLLIENPNSPCAVLPEREVATLLDDKATMLKELAEKEGVVVTEKEGVDPTVDEETYTFNFRFKKSGGASGEQASSLSISFVDLPGGWYSEKSRLEIADQKIRDSRVSFLAVDATALMELPATVGGLEIGKYHARLNRPDLITECYKRSLDQRDNPHLIVIVLIRAETYLKQGRRRELYEKARQSYSDLSKAVRFDGNPVSVVATAVETVGALRFKSFSEVEDDLFRSSFYRDSTDSGYNPAGCGYPLVLALQAILESEIKKQGSLERRLGNPLRRILEIIGVKTKLRQCRARRRSLEDLLTYLETQKNQVAVYEQELLTK